MGIFEGNNEVALVNWNWPAFLLEEKFDLLHAVSETGDKGATEIVGFGIGDVGWKEVGQDGIGFGDLADGVKSGEAYLFVGVETAKTQAGLFDAGNNAGCGVGLEFGVGEVYWRGSL